MPHAVKKERYALLTADLEKVAIEHTRKIKGKTVRLLVRDKDRKDGYLSGHTEGKIIVRFPSDDESLIGSFVDVRIDSVRPFSAEGELVTREVEA